MMDVFLSASVPLPDRHPAFFETADTLCIREAIKALVQIVLPIGNITFGGHPAITPLLGYFVREANLARDRVVVFQSAYFRDQFPPENDEFVEVHIVDAVAGDRERSLLTMRQAMLESRRFDSAVFIGGMEGVIEEARLVSELQPQCVRLPVASTGAAARMLYDAGDFPLDLANDLTYLSVFRRHLVLRH